MKMQTTDIILVTTIVSTALIAGLFYGYSVSVNPGLAQLTDKEYLRAMQSINIVIQNPLFFLSFMGSMVVLPISAYLQYKAGNSPAFMLLLASSAVYLIAVFGVTVAGNVPLNEALASFDISHATATAISKQREFFEKPWLMLHQIRTVGAVLALVLAVVSCFYVKQQSA